MAKAKVKTKTIVSVETLYLSINNNTNIIIIKLLLKNTISFSLKKHLVCFSCSSYILHIP